MKWITSERFFRPGYDFAIIAEGKSPVWRLPRARLVEMNGEPQAAVNPGRGQLASNKARGVRASLAG